MNQPGFMEKKVSNIGFRSPACLSLKDLEEKKQQGYSSPKAPTKTAEDQQIFSCRGHVAAVFVESLGAFVW